MAARFAEVSEELHQDASEAVTVQRVVDGAVRAVPGCDDCSLTLRGRGGAPDPVAETSTLLGVDHVFPTVLAVPLRAGGEEIGTLTLYGQAPDAFDEQTVALAGIYAAHAAQALRQVRTIAGLRRALESRHDIGIAQGVVAVRYEISYEEAFAVLQRYSNETNVKLRELARRVKADRALPPQPQPDRPVDPGQPRSAGRTSRP